MANETYTYVKNFMEKVFVFMGAGLIAILNTYVLCDYLSVFPYNQTVNVYNDRLPFKLWSSLKLTIMVFLIRLSLVYSFKMQYTHARNYVIDCCLKLLHYGGFLRSTGAICIWFMQTKNKIDLNLAKSDVWKRQIKCFPMWKDF